MRRVLIIMLWLVVIFVIGGIGSTVFNQTVIPKLATYERTREWSLVRSAQERTTIIERTERVEITENEAVRRIAAQLRSSAVMVKSMYAGSTRTGSGVFVTGDGIVAISSEALFDKENADVSVFLATGELLTAKRVVRDVLTGVAFIFVDKVHDYPAVSFARTEDFFAGQRLIEIGADPYVQDALYVFTTQMNAFLSTTSVGATDTWEGYLEANTLKRQLGSVLVTRRGELAALVGQNANTEISLLPAAAVRFALQRLVNNRAESTLDLGITYRSVTPVTLTDDAYGHGVVVKTVTRDGYGARAGLHVGDHVIAVGGEQLSPYRTLPVLLDERHDVEQIDITILRNGEEMVLPFFQQKESII